LALDKKGALWAIGANGYGQLGLGDNDFRYSFEKVPLPRLCPEGQRLDEDTGTCEASLATAIYFVNGVWNTEKDATKSRDLLYESYKDYLEKDEINKKQLFKFELGYNYSYGLISDLLEVIAQKQRENNYRLNLTPYDIFIFHISPINHILDGIADAADAMVQLQITDYFAQVVDTERAASDELIGKIWTSLEDKKRVILVSHSQGNLFANQIMQTFGVSGKYAENIAMIGVASPASVTYGDTEYWTADDDRVINILRAVRYNVLPANIDNDTGLFDGRDWNNHGFADSYFRDEVPSKAAIDVHFKYLIRNLKFPETDEN
jgi:hypothetical protein